MLQRTLLLWTYRRSFQLVKPAKLIDSRFIQVKPHHIPEFILIKTEDGCKTVNLVTFCSKLILRDVVTKRFSVLGNDIASLNVVQKDICVFLLLLR